MTDLPEPVARYREFALRDGPQRIDTLDIETDSWMRRPGTPPIPLSIRMAHRIGREFVHDIRIGRGPLSFRFGLDAYVGGHGFMKVGRTVHAGPTYDQGALIALWGEELAFPSAWDARDDVRWEPLDDATARFVVEGPEGPIVSTVWFHPGSGCPIRLEVDRYKGDGPKVRWSVRSVGWRRWPGGVIAPGRFLVRWADEARPWLDMRVTSLAVNVPVDPVFELAAGLRAVSPSFAQP